MARGYIDLHAHLDGAITVGVAKQLAEAQGITLPTTDDAELLDLLSVPETCTSLNDFLTCFEQPLSLLQTPTGLRDAVRLVTSEMASEGVAYTELRFAPQVHGLDGMTQEEAIRAALAGLADAAIPANLILCCMRGAGNEAANEETIELASKYLVEDGGVVALDLAGAEALFPTYNYLDLFGRARELGVPYTIHAGEAAGPGSVRDALKMGAARIGHGVRAATDEALVDELVERGTPLEMCPTSNRQTYAVPSMDDYPLADYLDRGVCVTLNTDDKAIERTTLAQEFAYAERELGVTPEQLDTMTENAVEAAFTSDDTRAELRRKLGL